MVEYEILQKILVSGLRGAVICRIRAAPIFGAPLQNFCRAGPRRDPKCQLSRARRLAQPAGSPIALQKSDGRVGRFATVKRQTLTWFHRYYFVIRLNFQYTSSPNPVIHHYICITFLQQFVRLSNFQGVFWLVEKIASLPSPCALYKVQLQFSLAETAERGGA